MNRRPIKLPGVLSCIAQALEVATPDETIPFKVRDRVMLYTGPSGRKLYCLKDPAKPSSRAEFERAISKNQEAVEAAMSLYDRWYKFPPVSGSLAKCPRGFLFYCGRASYIVYRSDKWIGKDRDYIHEFLKPPMVWVNNKTSPNLVVLSGGKIRVKPEGITG